MFRPDLLPIFRESSLTHVVYVSTYLSDFDILLTMHLSMFISLVSSH